MEPDHEPEPRSSCPQCRAVFRGGFLRCPRDGSLLSTANVDPLVGTVLAERYQIEALLGEGGIGRVYRARHVRMSRQYAIKIPFGELNYDTKVRARFHNEAEAASRLSHPNVIGVIDVGESAEGLMYMAMDLAEGENLASLLAREGALPADRIRRIFGQILEGLRHAHDRGLVHRDLKPENIILEQDANGHDRARIVDFGIALFKTEESSTLPTSGRLTTEGIVLGTPHYMAPEQATDQGIDHRTDLFSLGLILYEMLAGVLPFDGAPIEVARKNLSAVAPPISERVQGLVVDRLLEGLAFRMIEKRPDARPQTATETLRLLELIHSDRKTARIELKLGEVVEVEEMGVAPAGPRGRAPEEDGVAPVARKRPVATPLPSGGTPPALTLADEPRGAEAFIADDPPRDRPPANRRPLIIAAVVAVVMLLGLFVMLRDRGGAAAVSPPSDARRVVAVSPPDAAPPPDAPTPLDDAAPAPARIIDAAPAKRPDAGRPAPRKDAGAPPIDAGPKPPKVDAAPAAPPTEKNLTALYNDVGRALNDLISVKGATAGAAFKKRYLAIPYLDAIRKPEMRADAMTKLRALARDIDAAN